jgi:hypothetical protein
MTDYKGVGAARSPTHGFGQPRFLRTGHEMIDKHAEPSPGARPELLNNADKIIDATEELDYNSLDPQIIAPHLLNELGVVAAFDVDSTRLSHPGAGSRNHHRAGRGPSDSLGRRTSRRGQDNRFAVDEISGTYRKEFGTAVPVLKPHPAVFDAHHRADICRLRILDDHAEFYRQFGGTDPARVVRVAGQHVRTVTIIHPSDPRNTHARTRFRHSASSSISCLTGQPRMQWSRAQL